MDLFRIPNMLIPSTSLGSNKWLSNSCLMKIKNISITDELSVIFDCSIISRYSLKIFGNCWKAETSDFSICSLNSSIFDSCFSLWSSYSSRSINVNNVLRIVSTSLMMYGLFSSQLLMNLVSIGTTSYFITSFYLNWSL